MSDPYQPSQTDVATKPAVPAAWKSLKLLAWLSVPLYIADQITKRWVVANLDLGQERIEAVPGVFWIDHVANTGIAFGNFNGGAYSNVIFGIVALAAMCLILLMWRKGQFPTRIGRVAGALLIAGTLGNLTDRLVQGYVIDFLTVDLKFMLWPSFNLADAYICIAASLLFISAFQKIPQIEDHGNSVEKP